MLVWLRRRLSVEYLGAKITEPKVFAKMIVIVLIFTISQENIRYDTIRGYLTCLKTDGYLGYCLLCRIVSKIYKNNEKKKEKTDDLTSLIRRVVTSLSDVHWKHSCSLSTSVSSALEDLFRMMRYINRHYLLILSLSIMKLALNCWFSQFYNTRILTAKLSPYYFTYLLHNLRFKIEQ